MFPPKKREEEYMSKGVYINGFENALEYGKSVRFNWTFSNNARSLLIL